MKRPTPPTVVLLLLCLMYLITMPARRGFAQGITHAFARFGNAVTPPLVAWLIALVTWRDRL